MTVMDIEMLYPLVSDAIKRAEVLQDLGAPGAREAYLDVSLLEERIADLIPAADQEGAIARRGAINAALSAHAFDRARSPLARYSAEPDAGTDLRAALAGLSRDIEARASVATILVADDDVEVGAIIAEFLQDFGYRVVVAPSAGEALQRLEDEPGIRLLIADIRMPEKSGVELADRVSSQFPGIKTIVRADDTIRPARPPIRTVERLLGMKALAAAVQSELEAAM
jgi:CheY-like chemotaxis protein